MILNRPYGMGFLFTLNFYAMLFQINGSDGDPMGVLQVHPSEQWNGEGLSDLVETVVGNVTDNMYEQEEPHEWFWETVVAALAGNFLSAERVFLEEINL